MNNCGKNKSYFNDFSNSIYECEACGNHVCAECALVWRGVCPHCYSRLNRIS